jgi:hypothetical protein
MLEIEEQWRHLRHPQDSRMKKVSPSERSSESKGGIGFEL